MDSINMTYIDIAIKVSTKDLENASAVVEMISPDGFSVEDYSDIEQSIKLIPSALIGSELKNKDKNYGTIHLYIEESKNKDKYIENITKRLSKINIEHEISTKSLEEKDYATSWKKYYTPTNIGKNLVVIPTWVKYNEKNNRKKILLDPGMAFGTGTHETTKLCMEYIEEIIKKDDEVLDIGSGSGILGITAVVLGAKSSLGCDIDTVAVRVGKENAKINGVSDRCKFIEGDLTNNITGKYDIVLANIVADAVINLSKDVKSFIKSGGVFIVSGIIDERKDEVITEVEKNGFKALSIKQDRGWIAIKFLVNEN